MNKIQETEFNILKYISEVCEKNNIRYYLIYGTLLGAIRHEGFIPWDDDIDIVMPRKDYNKFKKIMSKDNSEKYLLCENDVVDNYPFIFPKVIYKKSELKEKSISQVNFKYGVYVDIFILDGVPKNKIERVYKKNKHKILYKLVRYRYLNEEYLGKLLKTVRKLYIKTIDIKKVQKSLNSIYIANEFDYADKVKLELMFNEKEYLPKEYFNEMIKWNFEGQEFNIPKKYDECLKSEYGEYKILPPIEQQKSNHNFIELTIDGEKII
ncbi:LicD family protein [uncultured Clostridium sp.]|uniref:LicD family protein n=1 Tax=uncultured Clostridium sp. TaxID=59620 RepID=UPI002611D5EB|nr:LicD family protein [uncultured Clostridium sp.]